MKTTAISSTLVFSLLLCSFTNRKTSEEGFTINEIEKSVSKFSENLYAGKYEVSNNLYRSFEENLKKSNRANLIVIAKVDSANWLSSNFYNAPYMEYYYRHPAYNDYPVVNISYDAANLFCQWLTEAYNQNPRRKFKKVLFRLPTQKEWETAAKAGEENKAYAWGNSLHKNNHAMCNYLPVGAETIVYDTVQKKFVVDLSMSYGTDEMQDNADVTAPVTAYQPNKLGLYNVCGNVAEMVQENGTARGGSWTNPGGEVRIASSLHYQKSSSSIGFRYFMEIQEK